MSKILNKINRLIEEYRDVHGRMPELIALNLGSWSEASYDVAKNEGLKEEDAYLNDLTTYRGIDVVVSHRLDFPEIKIR